MPRTSKIAVHPEREEIEKQIIDPRVSIRSISQYFGVGEASVIRYRDKVLLPRLQEAATKRQTRNLDTARKIVELLEDIIADLRSMAHSQREKGDYSGAGANLARVMRGLEVFLEIAQEDRQRQETSLAGSEEWAEVKETILIALAPYPEPGKVVGEALERLGI